MEKYKEIIATTTVVEFLKEKHVWDWILTRGGMHVGTQELVDLLEEYSEYKKEHVDS